MEEQARKKYQWEEVEDFQEGCRAIRLIGTIGLAAFIFYGLICVPFWVFASIGFSKFDPTIDGWVLGTGVVTLWILTNSAVRELGRGCYKQRRIGKERYEREKREIKCGG